MPRKLRIQYEGAIYHLMNRGDRREAIFLSDQDRELFLETLGQACQKCAWQVHAYCLMPNHFHLVLETPRANLVAGMQWFLSTYTARFNRRHRYFGHLFSGRYKSLLVDGSGNGYLKTVCDYVHLNPVRAKLLTPEQPLKAYRWSSWQEYLKRPRKRSPWLRVDRFMGEWGVRADTRAGRRRLEALIGQRRELDKTNADWKRLRRGWCFGPKEFREELLELIEEQRGGQPVEEAVRESDEQRAERLVQTALRKWHWSEAGLQTRRKSDPKKAELARQLRAETTMTWPWIAKRLVMGHWRTALNATSTTAKRK